MTKTVINNIARFFILVILQVLVLNNIQFSGFINPYPYILFILLLPFDISNLALLLIGFFLGFSVDVFSNTLGMHSAATVLIAFLRPFILKMLASYDDYEYSTEPSMQVIGISKFMSFAAITCFIHHFTLFYLEAFRFSDFFYTLLRIILSTIFSMLLIFLMQYWFVKFKKS